MPQPHGRADGRAGAATGAGGVYLFVPPGFTGVLPAAGYHVVRPRTNRVVIFYRVFVEKGDLAAATANARSSAAVFPLSEATAPPPMTFVILSGLQFNTISTNYFSFHEELNAAVQNEPADWVDPDTVGLHAAIGICKGQPFAPDARLRQTLTDAVAVGNAYARSNTFASRDPRTRIFKDCQWLTPLVGAATSSSPDRSGCWMPGRCSSTSPPASRRR